MLLKFLLPLLAIAGVCMAVYTVMADNKPKPSAAPVVQPAGAPFATYVAGAGLVEASTENISIGTHESGIVQSVYVKASDRVKAGDPLFTIDDRTVRAELVVRMSALASAEAELQKLKSQPRPEDLPPAESRVAAQKAILEDLEAQLAMWERADRAAIASEDLSKRRFAVISERARLSEAQSDLDRLKAGAWEQDLLIARAQIDSTQSQLEAAQVEVDRHTVKSPVDAEILKVNVRMGEFAQAGSGGNGGNSDPLITLGDTDTLHVRVDVDENDAWRVKSGSNAKAFVRGNPELNTPLKFVRFEPYVIPKKSLTGASTERVDTRVLQIIFSFEKKSLPVFVGQQMDVFIDTATAASSSTNG